MRQHGRVSTPLDWVCALVGRVLAAFAVGNDAREASGDVVSVRGGVDAGDVGEVGG